METNSLNILVNVATSQKYSLNRNKIARKSKLPQPSYSNFGEVDYVDSEGREYRTLSEEEQKSMQFENMDKSNASTPFLKDPPLYGTCDIGSAYMWIRLPISKRNTLNFPDAQNEERLKLFHVRSQVEIIGRVKGCFYESKGKTAYVSLTNIRTFGQTDPQKWSHIVTKKHRKYTEKSPF